MARFALGDHVRILDLHKEGHIRIPWYVRWRVGVIERYCGAFPNPEELAYARPGLPAVDLYRVRLNQLDIWSGYDGLSRDTLEIEVYDHWLEPALADEERLRDPTSNGDPRDAGSKNEECAQ